MSATWMPGVFPDYPGLVVRNTDGTEMTLMRWGMPPPPRTGGPPVTNIRNTSSPHWRMWLKPENLCLFCAISFAKCAPEPMSPASCPDHMQARQIALPCRPAFQGSFEFPDRRIVRPAIPLLALTFSVNQPCGAGAVWSN